jgi:hypothetical protein
VIPAADPTNNDPPLSRSKSPAPPNVADAPTPNVPPDCTFTTFPDTTDDDADPVNVTDPPDATVTDPDADNVPDTGTTDATVTPDVFEIVRSAAPVSWLPAA